MMRETEKLAGILMPIASLPAKDGAGSFGREAYRFVDILADMGIRIWQLLPLHPLGYGNSPYQPFSSFAGDDLYIDLDLLVKEGWLAPGRAPYEDKNPGRIDYVRARAYREPHLRSAYRRFRETEGERKDFLEFQSMDWVYPYGVFRALKGQNGQQCWNRWPLEQQNWILDQQYDISHLEEEIGYQIFLQYLFFRQWMDLKSYANGKKIQIMGDMPFYVGIDSLDVWRGREDFLLDGKTGEPAYVAGVAPDFFSPTGQRWGNPIYNWEHIEKNRFCFWLDRLGYARCLYDIIRIDHFRAFDTYWKVPASCPTAVEGAWTEAPGFALFEEVFRQMPDIRIVVEDLGELRPEVLQLRDHFGFLGMNVAEYNLPERDSVDQHQLIYTGTHDNQTIKGWCGIMEPKRRRKLRKVLAKYGHPHEAVGTKLLRYVYGSPAEMAIVPLFDILGLNDEARINTPGTVGTPNWEWKLADWKALRRKKTFMKDLIAQSGRAGEVAQ